MSPQIKSDDGVTATHAAQTQRVTGSAVENFGNIKSDELRESHVKVIIPLTEKDSRKLFVGGLPSNGVWCTVIVTCMRIYIIYAYVLVLGRSYRNFAEDKTHPSLIGRVSLFLFPPCVTSTPLVYIYMYIVYELIQSQIKNFLSSFKE